MVTTTTTTTYKCDQCAETTEDTSTYDGWITLDASCIGSDLCATDIDTIKRSTITTRLDFHSPDCFTEYIAGIKAGLV